MRKTTGYFLISVCVLSSLLLIGVLGLIAVQAQKTKALANESAVNHIHELRMELTRSFLSKAPDTEEHDWKNSDEIQTIISSMEKYAHSVSLNLEDAQILIELHSSELAALLNRALVETVRDEQTVVLGFPKSIDMSQWQTLSRAWNQGPSNSMDTSISLSEHQILGVEQFDAQQVLSNEAHTEAVLGQNMQGETMIATESQILGSAFLRDSFSKDLLSTSVFAHNFSSNTIESKQGIGNSIDSETALSSRAIASQLVVKDVAVENAEVESALYLTGSADDQFSSASTRLSNLEAKISNCVEVTMWCTEPSLPKVKFMGCSGCTRAQPESAFQAEMIWDIENCVHGCGLDISIRGNGAIDCNRNEIEPHDSITLQCLAVGSFQQTGTESLQVTLTVSNLKDPAMYVKKTVSIEWTKEPEIPEECASTIHIEPVFNSIPRIKINVNVPTKTIGEFYRENYSGSECRMNDHSSSFFCEVELRCTESGNWQPVSPGCRCM